MRSLEGLTDSIAGFQADPEACPQCAGSTTIGRGVCVNCLLQSALGDNGEGSREAFAAVLGEVNVPDREWRLGQYEILGEVGRGGMGVIYRARQRHSRRIVAVKRILSYEAQGHDTLVRFRREAEAAASLDHPNILPIYEVAETEEGVPYFSMKLATGGSLRAVGPALRDEPREAVRLMAKVARAVAYAHKQGILHRDLQPGNILLDGRGEPLVSDFGLAKWLDDDSDLTRTLTTFGTPGFIAPEQAEGGAAALSPAADIYSLGAILFHLLAARPPFVGPNALSVIRQAAEMPAPKIGALRGGLGRDLETILEHCLERDPKARYASADALAEDLERWSDGRPIRARRILPSTRLFRWSRRNPILAGGGLVCLALLAAVIWLAQGATVTHPILAPEKSIAVLPFEDLSSGEDTAFFTDGMQDDILINLAQVSDLKVISRSSVRAYKANLPRDLQAIGQDLGVRHVLEGSVRRSGDRVRINAHLTNTQNGEQIWAASYDRDLQDIFTIQGAIAAQIVEQLQGRLLPAEEAKIHSVPTTDLAAYDLYLRARDLIRQAGLSTADRSDSQAKLLNEAVQRAPDFVPALCLLARVHVLAYWSNQDHTPARLEAAWQALERAARLRPDAGEVHLTRGIVLYWGQRNYEAALAELLLAQRALPNDADIPYFRALITRRQGDWESSTRLLEEARAIDPRNAIILWDLARTNYFASKRYQDAAKVCEDALRWTPDAFDFYLARAKVDLAARADLRRWESILNGEPARYAEKGLLNFERLDLALAKRDYHAAEVILASDALLDYKWDGYVTPRAWYAGLIAEGLGETGKAREAFTAARDLLGVIVAQRPDDAKARIVLAEICARLGEKIAAVQEGERALRLRPTAKDAVDGPVLMTRFAAVLGRVGEPDRALALLKEAASLPNATNYGALRLDECWDPLRQDPRFEKIVATVERAGDWD